MLLIRLPINSRLLGVKFLETENLYADFQLMWKGISAPNPHIVQDQPYIHTSIKKSLLYKIRSTQIITLEKDKAKSK